MQDTSTSRKDSPASPATPWQTQLERFAPEASIISGVVARLRQEMSLAQALLFVTTVITSSSRGSEPNEHAAQAVGSDASTSPPSQAPNQRRKRVRSVAAQERRRQLRAGKLEEKARGLRVPLPVPKQPSAGEGGEGGDVAVVVTVAAPIHPPPSADEPLLEVDNSPLGRALEVSAREFASPERTVHRASFQVSSPLRNEFSDFRSHRRQMVVKSSPPPPSSPPLTTALQLRHEAIDFIKRNSVAEFHLGARELERILGELLELPPRDWLPHLAQAGGTYTSARVPEQKRRMRS